MENAPKTYLYHIKPEKVEPNEEGREVLYPLYVLKDKFPKLYDEVIKNYPGDRAGIPETVVPTLENTKWGDVVQLSAVKPEELRQALNEAGHSAEGLKFYPIDPTSLDPQRTTVFLHRTDIGDVPENYAAYDPEKVAEHSVIPEETKKYYIEQKEKGEKPKLYHGVPHIFHKGPIDVTDLPEV